MQGLLDKEKLAWTGGTISLPIRVSENIPDSIGELSGAFALVTGGKRTLTRLKNMQALAGTKIQRPEFEQAGIVVGMREPKMFKGYLVAEFVFKGNLENLVSVTMLDKQGEPLPEKIFRGQAHKRNSKVGKASHFFKFNTTKVPPQAVLNIETVTDPADFQVPFKFESVDVQSAPLKSMPAANK